MSLTSKEKERYNRHIILQDIGIRGQEKIKATNVLVVGAGGLGSPILYYLTAAGIGHVGIMDDDVVSCTTRHTWEPPKPPLPRTN